MLTIWKMNTIVTGHENGHVCLWGSDSCNKVVSNVLKNSVSALVEAKSNHGSLLLGSDFNGKIAIWNLTLHHLNPTQFQVEALISGFHQPEDPGILSLSFHEATKTVFSGGNDRTIRYWRLNVENSCSQLQMHGEPVCFLKCTDTFVISGDESGCLCVSRIKMVPNGASMGSRIANISLLCTWFCTTPFRCFSDCFEYNASRLFIVQIGGVGNGRTRVWEVFLQQRTVKSSHRKGRAAFHADSLLLHTSSLATGDTSAAAATTLSDAVAAATFLGGDHDASNSSGRGISRAELSKIDQLFMQIEETKNPDLYIGITEMASVTHDSGLEITSCALSFADAAVIEDFRKCFTLYIGTANGIILLYKFS
jgi:WD40 repeat protein